MTNVAGLTRPDFMFLAQAANVFNVPNLGFNVLDGDQDAIRNAINYAHTNGIEALLRPDVHDWMSHYEGALLGPVTLAVKANIAKEKATPPTGIMARMYAKMGLDPATRHTKLFNQYLLR